MGNPKGALKYLRVHANPCARAWLTTLERVGVAKYGGPWERVLVVAAYREAETLIDGFRTAVAAYPGPVLLVLVINAPTTACDADRRENAALLTAIEKRFSLEPVVWAASEAELPPCFVGHDGELTLLCIFLNRPPHDVPAERGVGFARKLGSDVAIATRQAGALTSPWLYQTDADVTLPEDYFKRPLEGPSGAVLFPFRHVSGGDPDIYRATLQVEVRLRYHVLGLSWAGSPYAWHSMGSCIVVDADCYCAVHGFPQRAAGEDYHLLQKIQKVAHVRNVPGTPLEIRSRRSKRTPFGTGPSVEHLLDTQALLLDDPRCFAALRAWLSRIERFVVSKDPHDLVVEERDRDPLALACQEALEGVGAFQEMRRLAQETQKESDRRTRLHTWFDGLKSQQLIHALRERGYPQVAAHSALASAPFTAGRFSRDSLRSVEEWDWARGVLAQLEEA